MSNINVCIVAGNLTSDPELRTTVRSSSVLSFSIACNESRKNNQTGEWDEYPNFFDVTMFGKRAESLAKFLRKGLKITVKGRLHYSSWEKDGQRRSKVSIFAEEVELPPKQQEAPMPDPVPQQGYAPAPEVQQAYASMGVAPENIQPSVYGEDIPF